MDRKRKNHSKMKIYGLVGRNIDYSFSRGYFAEKFSKENLLNHEYQNFDIETIEQIDEILKNKTIKGLNITIPYKQEIISYIDELDTTAKEIGAVNVIKIKNGKSIGFNSDYYGFYESIRPYLKEYMDRALILGTGGASKAITHALKTLKIDFTYVSRNPDFSEISYSQLDEYTLNSYKIIINCTPLGTYPNIDESPYIPYESITEKHLLYDLIYNPPITSFMEKGMKKGATVINGHKMLTLQAEKSWEIWNS